MKDSIKSKIFKNKVGRPSKEILKKRKIFNIGIVVSILVVVVITACFGIKKLKNIEGDTKNATNTKYSQMYLKVATDSSTRSLIIGNKKYKNGEWVEQTKIGDETLFVNSDGKTKIKVKMYVSKSFFKSIEEKSDSQKHKLTLGIAAYDSNLKIVNSSGFAQVKKDYFKEENGMYVVSGTVTVSSKVKYIIGSVKDSYTGQNVYYIQLNTALFPTIEIKPNSGRANSNGVVTVSSLKQYYSTVKIKNPSKVRLYYRWIKYNNLDMTSPSVSSCAYTDLSSKTLIKGLYVKSDVPNRMGYLRVYTSKKACQNDSKITKVTTSGNVETRPYLVAESIKYQLAKVYNAGNSWVRLRFDYNDLKSKIGKQAPGICFNYALSYGTYIKNDNGTYTKPLTNSESNYGATSYYASSYYDMYTKIKSKIDKGIPVSIHVGNKDSKHHWVLVTGYQKGISKSRIKDGPSLRKYLYVLDPYDLSQSKMSDENLAAWFYGDMRYITW